MEERYTGKVTKGGGAASSRFLTCKTALEKYGLNFPPLHFGTINLALNKNLITPKEGITIPFDELDEISLRNKESWMFIPLTLEAKSNEKAYLLRTTYNIHGNKVAEVLCSYINNLKRGDLLKFKI